MMKPILTVMLAMLSIGLMAQDKEDKFPASATELYLDVPKVTPGNNNEPPSDAIVLFDGKNLSHWKKESKDSLPGWKIENGELVVVPKKGGIATKQSFGDVQLHIEWMSPVMKGETGQGYANSGIFFMGKYELQVLNSHENETYSNGQAGSIYKQYAPLVNASRPPGTWQEYDVIFTAPKFSEKGTLVSPARITVFHNGVLIQNNVSLWGNTSYKGLPKYTKHAEKLPLALQDHTDPVRYRNIWIREL
ncbi:MAG: DUF1080 domain-containing protein [Cyclobacteriaceae bacterium]